MIPQVKWGVQISITSKRLNMNSRDLGFADGRSRSGYIDDLVKNKEDNESRLELFIIDIQAQQA